MTTATHTHITGGGRMALGNLLRAHRHRVGMTTTGLGQLVGCSHSYIVRIELGERIPDVAVAERLDTELGADGELLHVLEHYHDELRGRRSIPRVHQVPSTPPRLLGMEPWVSELDAASITTRPIVLTGPAGVGKTALAMHWGARRSDRYPEGTLILHCRGRSPTAPPRATHELVTALLSDLQVQPQPRSADRRAALLRSTLHHRRMLLILDDVASAEQVRPILDIPGITVVVTSRGSLPGLAISHDAVGITLPPCGLELGRRLLTTLIGHRAHTVDTSVLDSIAATCDGLPLALRAAAQWALTHPHTPLAEVAERLQQAPVATLHAATGDDDRVSVRAALAGSLRHLRRTHPEVVATLERSVAPTSAHERQAAEVQLQTPEVGDVAALEHVLVATDEGYRMPTLVADYLATADGAETSRHLTTAA